MNDEYISARDADLDANFPSKARRPKVYIVNRSAHDFSAAELFGDIIFLSEGPMNRYSVNNMMRLFTERMKDSHSDDYLVPCSLNVMNSIASAILAHKHGRLNLLLFKQGTYLERNIVFGKGHNEEASETEDSHI